MTTPRPKLDIFNESPCLVSKKCRTSTPSLRPPKPPTKSSKLVRRQRNSMGGTYNQSRSLLNSSAAPAVNLDDTVNHQPFQQQIHDGSFSFGLMNGTFNAIDEYSRMYQHFEIVSKIGSGHFADVYKAKSLMDGRYYAIKKTSIPFTSNSDRHRKLQEVRNHQMLPPHPNCVHYYDSWEEDGYLYIQTELCQGSLNGILESCEEHKLPEQMVWNYLLDLLLAVKHLHDHDLLHLDIKPDNIFISFDGVAKLGDFGLVCSCLDLNSSTISAPHHNAATSSINNNNNNTNNNNNRTSKVSPSLADATNTANTNHNHLSSDDDSIFNIPQIDHDDSGILNRSDESVDSIDEGDSKYLAAEAMQGKFTKAMDVFSLGITIFEVASGLDLPQRGEVYHKLRHNEIEDLYFNGLSADLVKVIKMMMEEDYTKRPTVDDLLRLDFIHTRGRPNIS